jgi:hypothetical protein
MEDTASTLTAIGRKFFDTAPLTRIDATVCHSLVRHLVAESITHVHQLLAGPFSPEISMLRTARIAEEAFHSSLASWQRLLLTAATDIKRHGWCRFMAFNDDKKCIMGALHVAAFRAPRSVPVGAFEAAQYALVMFLEHPVPHWNDTIARNPGEVIYVLQLVACGGDAPKDDEPELRRVA